MKQHMFSHIEPDDDGISICFEAPGESPSINLDWLEAVKLMIQLFNVLTSRMIRKV
jgi:hypothetical protein